MLQLGLCGCDGSEGGYGCQSLEVAWRKLRRAGGILEAGFTTDVLLFLSIFDVFYYGFYCVFAMSLLIWVIMVLYAKVLVVNRTQCDNGFRPLPSE